MGDSISFLLICFQIAKFLIVYDLREQSFSGCESQESLKGSCYDTLQLQHILGREMASDELCSWLYLCLMEGLRIYIFSA